MSKRLLSHASILGANIIYGVNYTVAKEVIPEWMHPFALVLCRVLGALLLFLVISIFTKHEKIERKDLFYLIAGGIFGVAVNQMLFLKGLSTTTPIDASIIMTINPVLVLVIAAIILHEKITPVKILGIIIGAAGAILLILNSGKISLESGTFVGNILVFINALSYGLYLVIIKPLMKKYTPLTVIKWVFSFGFFFVFPFGINPLTKINWSFIPLEIYFAIAFVIVATTFIAYLLNIYGLKNLSPTTVSIYIYSQPIIASLVAVILGKDSLNFVKIVSALLVFIGVFLVSKPVFNKQIVH
ncbi:MAG: DMT family transporter [Chlorobi bacterium]|nr:DMT family transporter [Chlorobiota bacterium]